MCFVLSVEPESSAMISAARLVTDASVRSMVDWLSLQTMATESGRGEEGLDWVGGCAGMMW